MNFLVFSTHDKQCATLVAIVLCDEHARHLAARYRPEDVSIRDCGAMNRYEFGEMIHRSLVDFSHDWKWNALPGMALADKQEAA